MSLIHFITESENTFLKFFNFEPSMLPELVLWIDSLKLKTGKAPRGLKAEYENLKWIARKVESYDAFSKKPKHLFTMLNPNSDYDAYLKSIENDVRASFARMTIDDMKKVTDKLLTKAGEVTEIKLKHATYYNESTMASSKFVASAKQIDKHLSTFKGPHKKALDAKPLVVRFVKKEQSKSTAVYKSMQDEIYIRPDRRFVAGDGYGSFIYIITHELGHRYEDLVSQMSSLHRRFTTKYSQTDSMSGSEAFAELFALSHFGINKYPEYEKQIEEFNRVVK
jgi:hypothetical protein